MFPNASVTNGEMTKSDHQPLLLDTDYLDGVHVNPSRCNRKFEARWLKEETVEEIVKASWARAKAQGEGPTFMQKAKQVHDDLHVWDKETLQEPVKRKRKLQKQLKKLRRGALTDENIAAQKETLVRA